MTAADQDVRAADRRLAVTWLVGGAVLAALCGGLGELLGWAGWFCALLFLALHTKLLVWQCGGLQLRDPQQMNRTLCWWASDLLWMMLVDGPWKLCILVCMAISTGVVIHGMRRAAPSDS